MNFSFAAMIAAAAHLAFQRSRQLFTCLAFLFACAAGHSADSKIYDIKNAACGKCILITIIGHGVAEGHEGKYYLPADYTLQKFWKERPVLLYLPASRISLTRENDKGEEVRYSVDAKKSDADSLQSNFRLKDGDIVFVMQPPI